jgi:DNA polymerase-1
MTEMMFNGLCVDAAYFVKYAAEVATNYADCKINLQSRVGTREQIEDGYYPIVNIESPLQWGKFLFGGMKNNTTKEAVGVYKNGKPKYKKVTTLVKTAAFCDIAPLRGWVSDKTGNVSVDEKVIQYIINNTKITIIKELMTKLLNHRELAKQLTTYIQGLGKHLIKDKATSTDYIYGRLNQVATATGRLSSTSPNLQNISNNPIKKIFVSRWTEPGTWPIATISDSKSFGSLVEFDFSQIEVAVLAHVSKDKQLIKDIKDGLDIHSELHKDMFGSYPDEATRKWFKKLTFGLIYGAGANTLAENAGCTYDTAKHFITAFYKRYPDVACWHKQMALWADTRGEHAVTPLGGLEVNRSCKWQSETGRFYMFREYKSTYRTDRDFTFSPTELKNYPIQGLATGDIVPLMMGILFRKLIGLDGVKLVNTVHDSILLDIRNDVLKDTIRLVGGILNQTSVYFDKTFGHKLELDLKTDCKVGKNWYEMVKEDK